MTRDDFRFFHHLRVRWAEVDMQKIVFNAHYLMYFDTAVADYWRALALPYEEAMHQLQGDLYVKKATVEFHASARMDDRLDIGLRARASARRRCCSRARIFRGPSSC
jgi:YbgC/YbaW family acyl-CoA thioester hydrolase